MKWAVLFLILSCSIDIDIMTFSDAAPIQFWLAGQDTYNEKEVCGIEPACFCQPFNCSDDIVVQFKHGSGAHFNLQVIDEDTTLMTAPITEVSSGVYQIIFSPEDFLNCSIDEIDDDFAFDLDGWQNYDLVDIDWEWVPDNGGSIHVLYSYNQDILAAKNITAYPSQATLTIEWEVDRLQSGTEFPLLFYDSKVETVFAGGGTLVHSLDIVPVALSGTYEQTISSALMNQIQSMGIETFFNSGGAATNFWIRSISLKYDSPPIPQRKQIQLLIKDSDGITVAKSDCLEITQDHKCTELIAYSNSKEFADLEYPDISPSSEFYLRVPAMFFHEQFPEEEESIELSNENSVRLRNEIKAKRVMEMGYMPYYMHRKLKLVLAHDNISIGGKSWIKQDAYEIDPGNKHYPLKRGTVLLTEQNYIKRNIL